MANMGKRMIPEWLTNIASLPVMVYPPSNRYPAVGVTRDGRPFGAWSVIGDEDRQDGAPLGKFRLGDLTWNRK